MNILIDIVSILVLFFFGSLFVKATAECYAEKKYGGYGVGIMFSAATIIVLFRVLITM